MGLFDRLFLRSKKPQANPPGSGLGAFARKDTYKVGDKIGNEYLVNEIFGGEGKSGMGIVYKTHHAHEPLPVAMKTFQGEYSADATAALRKEVDIWGILGIPPEHSKS